MKSLFIYCAGGAGKEVCDTAELIQETEKKWKEICFIDDTYDDSKGENTFYGKNVLTYEYFKNSIDKNDAEVIIATGEPLSRKKLYEKVERDGYDFANVICPNAIVSPTAKIGKGVVIQSFCHIASNAVVEDNVFLNFGCIVGHDAIIKRNTFFSVHVSAVGGCVVGENCFFGIGAMAKDHISIGDWCIVGMSAVITKNIESEKIITGIPAKVIKDNIDKKVFK